MIYLVLGRREQGKSTLGLFIARMRTNARQLLVDPRAQFDAQNVFERPTFAELVNPAMSQIVVRLNRIGPEFAALMLHFRKSVEKQPMMPQTLLLDEARFLDLADENLDWVCRCARRDIIDIVITAHRPKDVPVDLRAIADYWCLFPMTQEHDLQVIEERCGTKTRRIVERLAARQYALWDDGKAVVHFSSNPERWYVPMTTIEQQTRPDVPVDVELEDGSEWKLK